MGGHDPHVPYFLPFHHLQHRSWGHLQPCYITAFGSSPVLENTDDNLGELPD